MNDELFQRTLWDKNQILYALLPDRRRKASYELIMFPMLIMLPKLSCLTDST